MINILHAIDTTGPGGAETVFLNIATKLDNKKFSSHVVISGKGWVFDQLTNSGVKPIIISSSGSFNLIYLWKLIRTIKIKKIDIIHSHLLGSNVYCSVAGLFCNVPVVSTFHGFVDAQKNDKLLKMKFRLTNWGSQKIVFVSQHLKRYFTLNTIVDDTKTEVIYNGIDLNKFKPKKSRELRQKLGLHDNDLLIGAIGNIRKAKGYDILLKAAAKLKKNRPDCKFVVIGEGSGELFEDILNLKKELQLDDTVFFIGFRNNTPMLLNNFDIFVLPSTTEGFSISTIEAMACGIPVIVTKSGGPEEIVSHQYNGLLVPPSDPVALASSISNLSNNKSVAQRYKNNALLAVQENFSISRVVNSYSEQYNKIIASPLCL